MDVSVIIVSYNSCKLTLQAVASVMQHTTGLHFEIIVVDNGSSDDTVVTLHNQFPEIIVIENEKNIGFGQANNIAVNKSRAEFCFFLNSDAYLLNNSILEFRKFLANNPDVFAAGGQLLFENFDANISVARFPCYENFIAGSFWRHFYKKHFYLNKLDHVPYDISKIQVVDYVSGANLFIRTSIFKEFGGFRKQFFMYFEETELQYRIKKLNPTLQVYFLPYIKIVHIGQGSNIHSTKSIRFKLMYLKSRAYYFRFQIGKRAFFMIYLRGLITIFLKK